MDNLSHIPRTHYYKGIILLLVSIALYDASFSDDRLTTTSFGQPQLVPQRQPHQLTRSERELADPCRHRMNDYTRAHADHWHQNKLPILSFVSEAPPYSEQDYKTTNQTNLYFIFATMTKKFIKDPIMKRYIRRVNFTCGKHIGRVVGTGCPSQRTFIVMCPLDYSINELVATPKRPRDPLVTAVVYNVTQHMICLREEKEHRLQELHQAAPHDEAAKANVVLPVPLPPDDDNDDVRVAHCLIVHGKLARGFLKRHIAYHRLIGVEHTFIYLHDNSSQLDGLPLHQDDITYIPTDFMSYYMIRYGTPGSPGMIYQQSQIHECLMRCRSAGFDFAILGDVDEFVQIMEPNVSSLKEFLRPYKQKPGVLLHSVLIPPLNTSYWEPAWFDWTWQFNSNISFTFTKAIAHVGMTHYHAVHVISSSLSNETIVDVTNRSTARLAHLRNVPGSRSQSVGTYNLTEEGIPDLSFDRYRKDVVRLVNMMD